MVPGALPCLCSCGDGSLTGEVSGLGWTALEASALPREGRQTHLLATAAPQTQVKWQQHMRIPG